MENIQGTHKKTRRELQDEAIRALLFQKHVIVNWATGTGKSRVAVGCADRLERSGKGRILLLVAETAHKDNWRKEFVEALGQQRGGLLFSSIVVECYASLYKYEWTQWDFVIADEAHHLRSESRTDSISTVGTEYFLCLSATMSCDGDADDLLRMLEMMNGRFVNLDFTTQEAIDNDILKEPVIYTHFLNLDDMKVRQPIKEEWGPSRNRVQITCRFEEMDRYMNRSENPAMSLSVLATPRQAYDYYSGKMAKEKGRWQDARDKAGLKEGEPDNGASLIFWNRYVLYGSLRKAVLGRAKTTFCKWLLTRIAEKKYICFCSDVEQAEVLGGENVIHSGRTDNMSVIDAYNGGSIRSIFAVNMIQEGQNLNGIQAGVVIQLGGKERQFIQKFGRTLRAKDTPEQHIVVFVGTRDEDYYGTAVDGINKKYIRNRYYGTAKEAAGRPKPVNVEVKHPSMPGLSRIERVTRTA